MQDHLDVSVFSHLVLILENYTAAKKNKEVLGINKTKKAYRFKE